MSRVHGRIRYVPRRSHEALAVSDSHPHDRVRGESGADLSLDAYQERALATDQHPGSPWTITQLGLNVAIGKLAEELRLPVPRRAEERLGDILWHLAKLARSLNAQLSSIAAANLKKNAERWGFEEDAQLVLFDHTPDQLYDERFPPHQQLPRRFQLEFRELPFGSTTKLVISCNGVAVGDPLTDNSHDDDGYRYHDALHVGYAAVLGWSPVTRALLKCKRKDDPRVDEIEDGARAILTEEAITTIIARYAKQENYFRRSRSVSTSLLEVIQASTAGLEVRNRSAAEWERAILEGYRAYRRLHEKRGGILTVDLLRRRLTYRALPGSNHQG